MKFLGSSWRTSVLGWLGLISAAAAAATAFLSGDADSVDWQGLWAALILVFPSVAALFAQDNNA